LALVLAWCCMVPAVAQEKLLVHADGDRQICTVRMAPFAGSDRLGGFGWIVVDVQSHDRNPHALSVRLMSRSWGSNDIELRRSIALGPEERAHFVLPLPNVAEVDFETTISIDSKTYQDDLRAPSGGGVTALLVSDRAQLQPQALALMQAIAAADKPGVVSCSGLDLPPDWRLLTGFELVLLDARSPLEAGAQEALRRYVQAGGNVLVASPQSLSAGPVRDRIDKAPASLPFQDGLGCWLVVPDLERNLAEAKEQCAGLGRLKLGLWPMPQPLLDRQPVPGLGRPPVLVFLSVILLFAILAGPVNFLLLRRWRRPLLALVTVPALGIGTTLLILGFGIFHDGFGVRGTMRSWTLLDQERHEAVAFTARTLFAGLVPGALTMSSDALIVVPDAFARDRATRSHRWAFDADRGALDGGVLPSRTLTAFGEAQQGVARQRLRFGVRGDGALDVLTDGGVQITGDLLLRDRDGALWGGDARGLRPMREQDAKRAFDQFLRQAGAHTTERRVDNYGRRLMEPVVKSLDILPTRMLGGGELPPGTWIGRVAKAPWLDEHGLSVSYDVQEHFVVGRLAAEDFVR
jgi:hypothetical protein